MSNTNDLQQEAEENVSINLTEEQRAALTRIFTTERKSITVNGVKFIREDIVAQQLSECWDKCYGTCESSCPCWEPGGNDKAKSAFIKSITANTN